MNKAFLIEIIKKLTSGIFIGAGVMISIFGVIAFESLSSNPSNSGNQSLMSPILSKIGGAFDRDTMSMEAIARGMVNWRDCEYKTLSNTYGNTATQDLSCSTGYEMIGWSCNISDNDAAEQICYLSGNNTLTTYENRGSGWTGQIKASIKCCKYLVP